MHDDCTDYRSIFLDDVPLMDVRAPVDAAFQKALDLFGWDVPPA